SHRRERFQVDCRSSEKRAGRQIEVEKEGGVIRGTDEALKRCSGFASTIKLFNASTSYASAGTTARRRAARDQIRARRAAARNCPAEISRPQRHRFGLGRANENARQGREAGSRQTA